MSEQVKTKPAADVPCGRILVVDDEVSNRVLLSDMLEARGYAVLLAEDGRQAIEMAVAERPDTILLDIMMPIVDGYEVCRRLKADSRCAPIPILLLTSLANREARIKGVDAGADDFLQKPADTEELVLRVRNAVQRKHLYDELQARYEELKVIAELHKSLTTIIDADTETLSSLMSRGEQPDPADGGMPEGTGGATAQECDHAAH